jgi:hypothetical protein
MSRAIAAYVAVGGTSLLTLAALNAAADKFPNSVFAPLRDYLVRRNG